MARWFSEQQLRTIHDAAFRVAGQASRPDAPVVGAGTGRWQIRRLAERLERRFVDFADIIPAADAVRSEASNAAPAAAVALLAGRRPDRVTAASRTASERFQPGRRWPWGPEFRRNCHAQSHTRPDTSRRLFPLACLRARRRTDRIQQQLPHLPHDEARRQPAWSEPRRHHRPQGRIAARLPLFGFDEAVRHHLGRSQLSISSSPARTRW